MDYAQITQMIGSLGFPIVCCGYMMMTMNKTVKENTESTNKLTELVTLLISKSGGNIV